MKENPFVFPQDYDDPSVESNVRRSGGLTLLDDIALRVIPEIIRANMEKTLRENEKILHDNEKNNTTDETKEPNVDPFSLGMIAYQVADGVLAAREAFLKGPVPEIVMPDAPKLVLPE
jgi:hypothetical protein